MSNLTQKQEPLQELFLVKNSPFHESLAQLYGFVKMFVRCSGINLYWEPSEGSGFRLLTPPLVNYSDET